MEKPLWSPSAQFVKDANLQHYIQWLQKNRGLSFHDYQELWQWSVDNTAEFWKSLWEYFNILHDGEIKNILTGDQMPFISWFEGTRLNYAEHVFRKSTDVQPAIIHQSEDGNPIEISWQELTDQTASIRDCLKQLGIKKDDRIAAYMPCIPEATVAFLAANAIGAIWSSCSPDFGVNAVIDRFSQIEPKVLFAVDYYCYGGKTFERADVVAELVKAIPSIEKVILLSSKNTIAENYIHWKDASGKRNLSLTFERVPFSHPIWVLYSSGTTGLPKAITHSHGGILLEQLKYGTFHNNFKPGERCFWYTTTGWMMWNYIHGSLLAGATMVLYDGSPGYPNLTALWKFIQDAQINHFGTSASFILANMKEQLKPSTLFDLSSLRSIGSTGSTLPEEGFNWIYQEVKQDLWLASMSGGTDVCSAFVGGNPLWPVYAGEIQCRALGCNLNAFTEDGEPIFNEVGEMVISSPMPSMPIYFWNDPDYKRYKESYFEMFPNVWRHGDWIKITQHQGIIIYGRSDATLNRGGIRIGTSEVYRAVDKVPEVKDSIVICLEKKGGEFWMPLFVVMKEGYELTFEIKKKINQTIRQEFTPRHVPDEIIAVPDIPYTISGKKTEMPVKKILAGKNPTEVLASGSLKNPESMTFFINLVKESNPLS
ncbi:MAG TPA: acetoacetate--CoA ligase [Cyclobacteriaceae bacterium]|jgi:acetoacetyl-CoA synthetase|nr:acetoacetate--CoA ligase [Cyclobacteriaceae bacterium]